MEFQSRPDNATLHPRPTDALGDWRWVLVAVLYGAMIGLHPIVIGVQPLPL